MTDNLLTGWNETSRDLAHLAHALGAEQSPREAQINAWLDELARGPLPEIPTEAEALEWAEDES